MTTPPQPQAQTTIEDYLEGEQCDDTKPKYLAGQVVATGGGSDKHGLIVGSLYAALLPAARHKGGQLFIADMKVRMDHDGDSDL